MTAATQSLFSVQAINSNHEGSEFGVIRFDDALAQPSVDECMAMLAGDGWSNAQEVTCTQAGVHTFLVSRRK